MKAGSCDMECGSGDQQRTIPQKLITDVWLTIYERTGTRCLRLLSSSKVSPINTGDQVLTEKLYLPILVLATSSPSGETTSLLLTGLSENSRKTTGINCS